MLDILYVSTLCSDEVFSRIFSASEVKPQQQAQKFHSLLTKGLAESGVSINALTRAPVDSLNSNQVGVVDDVDKYGVRFEYLNATQFSYFRHLTLFLRAFFRSLIWGLSRHDRCKIIVCDVLNFSISAGAMLAARVLGIKTVAVVTDLPGFLNFSRVEGRLSRVRRLVYQFLSDCLVGWYDFYMVLTEDINRVVNTRGRPHVVIEGMVDFEMASSVNSLDEKFPERVVVYAGALYEKFGVGKLVDAFSRVQGDDFRLWLFGAGDMVPEIQLASQRDSRIKYFGVVKNAEIVEIQLKATLLVNPRPSSEEFTKYSFPSKNMEYMVSGTPLLTTPLPGMPSDYFPYIYIFEDESIDGMASALNRVLTMPRYELHKKGLESKRFVLDKKNNKVQALVLVDLINFS